MRMNHGLRNISFAFLLTPVLFSGCGNSGTGPDPGTTALVLPDCSDGQLLGTDASGSLVCKNAPQGSFAPTSCNANQALNSVDGIATVCVDLGTGTNNTGTHDKITTLSTSVDDQTTRAMNIAKGGGPGAVFVGPTDVQPSAQIKRTGSETGLHAANDLCGDKYAGSHMCTVWEMYNSVVAGQFKMADVSATKRYWILFPSWNSPIGTPHGPGQGYADNCGSMSYPTHDKAWTGIQVAWELLETGSAGFSFYGGDLAKCSDATRAIACCK